MLGPDDQRTRVTLNWSAPCLMASSEDRPCDRTGFSWMSISPTMVHSGGGASSKVVVSTVTALDIFRPMRVVNSARMKSCRPVGPPPRVVPAQEEQA